VQPGAGPDSLLTTVVSVDPIYAKVDADENALLKYVKLSEEGKRVSARTAKIPAWIELGNETDFPHEGTIDFVDNRLDPGTGTVRARIVLKTGTLTSLRQASLFACAFRAQRLIGLH